MASEITPKKRKLESNTLEVKYQALKAVEAGQLKKSEIATKFNIKPCTLSVWIKKKEEIIQSYEQSSFSPAAKRMRKSSHEDIEKALDLWFRDARASNVPVNGLDLSRLPCQYAHQRAAWMDCEIFSTWVKKLDNKMRIRGHKIALIMDNCRAHPDVIGLKSVTLYFLPPNTISHTQPMDQGIIQNLKVHYRNLFVKRALLPAVEKKEDPKWNLLDTLQALRDAWDSVTAKTISNCFKHCGFQLPESPESAVEDDDPEDDIPLAILAANLKACGFSTEPEDFVNADKNVETTSKLTDEEIVTEVQSKPEEAEEISEETSDDSDKPSYASAMAGLNQLRRYMVALPGRPLPKMQEYLKDLLAIENDLDVNHHVISVKQTTIKDFF